MSSGGIISNSKNADGSANFSGFFQHFRGPEIANALLAVVKTEDMGISEKLP
jgi:hypothetical protein